MTRPTRLPDWEPRLAAYIDATAGRPFAWGDLDCALFAAGAVEAMTGVDLAASFRGRYRTAAGARRKLRAAGFEDQVAFVAAHFDEMPMLRTRPGDLLTLAHGALAVRQGRFAWAMGEQGLGLADLSDARRGFRV